MEAGKAVGGKHWPHRQVGLLMVSLFLVYVGLSIWPGVLLDAAEIERTEFQGGSGAAGTILRVPGSNLARVQLERLPSLPEGRNYQLWTLEDGELTSAGVLLPGSGGIADVVISISDRATAVWLTHERVGGAPHPWGTPMLVAALAEM